MEDFSKITKKWHKNWEDKKIFKSKKGKKNFYVLEMFPYPSGHGLHMGHAFNYTIGDVQARFRRMQGYNVLYPMGFDSFGLPAENAAIKNKSHPKKFTEDAIKNYLKQMNGLSLSYDWDRLIQTHKPDYYKWDQWIFLKMYEKGLVYNKKAPVNWCDECNTVLANEQVHNGFCWRHDDTEVEVKYLDQWYFKITEYADELYEGINELKEWPSLIKTMQKNWIGKSEGAEVVFEIEGEKWPVFTTRPDTLYGVTFLVISAQHDKLKDFVTEEHKKEYEQLKKKIKSVKQEDFDNMEKEGFFTGSYATHPLTGEKVPVYAGNFVLADYGSGMVMAVPAHDQRDFEFAKKYNIKIKQVISKDGKEINLEKAYTDSGVIINSNSFNGKKSEEGKKLIVNELEKKNLGKKTFSYKLRDWLISRQRFWGTPIPVVKCDKCGFIPVPENDLPVKLPEHITFESSKNPLKEHKEFTDTKCPKCKSPAKRETDTMDTFVNSSWYYLRYTDPKNDNEIFSKESANSWAPVNLYIGGKEHACMHLIYIRFYTKFLRDIGLLNFDEPAIKLFNQGMLQGPDGQKMSKSKGNIVLPETIYETTGLDPARFFLVSVASPDKDINWSDKGLEGSVRFLNKFVKYVENIKLGKTSKKVESKIHKTVRDMQIHYENLEYNLAVIKFRELFEKLEDNISKNDLETVIKILNPVCPHICEELWEHLGHKNFLALEEWPSYDEKLIDEKAEYLDELIDNVKQDVQEVLELTKIEKPKEIKLIVSNEWKYSFVKDFKELIEESRDYKFIIKNIMQKDYKKHSKEITKLIPGLLKDASKVPKQEITLDEEYNNYKTNKKVLEKIYNCSFIIEKADESNEKKSSFPAKPGIIIN